MLEAKLGEAGLLKKILDGEPVANDASGVPQCLTVDYTAVKELVTDANFECNEEGIHLQAMDNSHVALVSVLLHTNGFVSYRCDRPIPLGMNLGSLSKVLKCAKDDDICTLKALDEPDTLNLIYEAKRECHNILKSRTPSDPAPFLDADRVAAYDMKLMDIDIDSLSIPDTEYEARITMPATEFARIVRDLASLGESVRIEVSKEGVRFTCDGEAANANILLRQSEESGPIGKVKQLKTKEEEGAPSSSKKVKKEDGDVDMEDEDEEEKPAASEGEEEQASENEDEDEEDTGRKRKKKVCLLKVQKDAC